MLYQLHQNVFNKLKTIIDEDGQSDQPVVQSISLFFWANLEKWIRQIAINQEPYVIALTGASGSGKSFIRELMVELLAEASQVAAFTQDNYYRDFEADFPHLTLDCFYDEIDFDDPAHIRFKKLAQDLDAIKTLPFGTRYAIPKLRFGTPAAKPTIIEEGVEFKVAPFIVTEGIHAFHDPITHTLYDFKIYVDIDEKARRERWLERNRLENRGTTDNMWNTTVECLHEYILPTRQVADLVLNNNVPQEKMVAFIENLFSVLLTNMDLATDDDADDVPASCKEIA